MPELPEVETTLRGIKSYVINQTVTRVEIRQSQLRWPISAEISSILPNERIDTITRRSKYILLGCAKGTVILHLGMSGSVRVLDRVALPGKHDHVDIYLSNGYCLRYTDPRRFGALLWTADDCIDHPLLKHIGPEPLSDAFTGAYLWQRARKKTAPVKNFIMDGRVVAGVGNIYATEALFVAGIHPKKAAGRVSAAKYGALVIAIKAVLARAIEKGGTTLKDFRKSDGAPGYFSIELKAYGRAGEPCCQCGGKLKSMLIAQRASVFCGKCQR